MPVTLGGIGVSSESRPSDGSTLSRALKTRISRIPSQKTGRATPMLITVRTA